MFTHGVGSPAESQERLGGLLRNSVFAVDTSALRERNTGGVGKTLLGISLESLENGAGATERSQGVVRLGVENVVQSRRQQVAVKLAHLLRLGIGELEWNDFLLLGQGDEAQEFARLDWGIIIVNVRRCTLLHVGGGLTSGSSLGNGGSVRQSVGRAAIVRLDK